MLFSWYIAPKPLTGFSFFQLFWLLNIYLIYLIATSALEIFRHIISVLASVTCRDARAWWPDLEDAGFRTEKKNTRAKTEIVKHGRA